MATVVTRTRLNGSLFAHYLFYLILKWVANVINTLFQIAKRFRFWRPRLLVQFAAFIVWIIDLDPPFPPKCWYWLIPPNFMMSVPRLLPFFQRRCENLKPRSLCHYSYVTRTEVDLLQIDFLVTCVTFNASNDSATYANMRRLRVIKKFSKFSHHNFQQPFHVDLRYERVPGPFAWTGVDSKEATSFNWNKLLGEAANSFYSCSALAHFRGMASPIYFLQLSLFLAADFDFLVWSKSTVSLQTPSSHLLLCFPTGLLLPNVLQLDLGGGRFRSTSAQKRAATLKPTYYAYTCRGTY